MKTRQVFPPLLSFARVTENLEYGVLVVEEAQSIQIQESHERNISIYIYFLFSGGD
jgi:hypothetical protein